jgi:uncharacterized protein
VTKRTIWNIDVPGRRVDGADFTIPVHELVGDAPGPTTALVAGLIGDKPLGVLALRRVIDRLVAADGLRGTVLVVPALNPFGFQGGTRSNPDQLELNRRFPGRPHGFLTDQLARAVSDALVERVDVLVDLHSGTPSRSLCYAYDYGDLELSASFGSVPVVTGRAVPGQLCTVVADAGKRALLAEFGGASLADPGPGVEGCLNVLRHVGHLDGPLTGPDAVAVIEHVKVFLASFEGVLESPWSPADVGRAVSAGTVASISNVMTGETMEEFVVEDVGSVAGTGPGFDVWGPGLEREFVVEAAPLLMVANTVPSMIHAGDFACAVGWPTRTMQRAVGNHDG